jgi:hypothetical protein
MGGYPPHCVLRTTVAPSAVTSTLPLTLLWVRSWYLPLADALIGELPICVGDGLAARPFGELPVIFVAVWATMLRPITVCVRFPPFVRIGFTLTDAQRAGESWPRRNTSMLQGLSWAGM